MALNLPTGGGVVGPNIPVRPARSRRPRRWIKPRDRFAAETLKRANGVCDICNTTHGQRHGPLIVCVNGIALCRECQLSTGIRPMLPNREGARGVVV